MHIPSNLKFSEQNMILFYRTRIRWNKAPSGCAGVMDALFAAPMLSIAHHAQRHDVSFPNVAKAVEFWKTHGLLTEVTNQKRNRIFVAAPILDVTRPKPAHPARSVSASGSQN